MTSTEVLDRLDQLDHLANPANLVFLVTMDKMVIPAVHLDLLVPKVMLVALESLVQMERWDHPVNQDRSA